MPFRLRLGRPIEKELRRLGLAQLDRAMAQLAPGSDLATGIHDARKCLKRARALVRLARYGVGDEQFKALNSAMRDSARLVAPSRDRLVAHQTLGWLEVQSDEEPGTFSALLAAPVAHASAAGPAPEGGPSAGLHDADNKTTSHSAEGAAAAAVVLIAPTRDAMAAVFSVELLWSKKIV